MTDLSGPLSGLSVIAPNYPAILSDVWGVVHNGARAYPSAVEALRNFRDAGGAVVLITNAAWPKANIIEMLDGMGVPRDAYDDLIASGDMTRKLMAPYAGGIIHWVGPARGRPLLDGLDVTLGPPEKAACVLISDPDDLFDDLSPYEPRVARWRELGLPAICANPDKVVEHDGRIVYCAGAIADLYEQAGGDVTTAGKPHAPIYAEAQRLLSKAAGRDLGPADILAIGDSARTDATGAARFGADLMFITGSIHAEELEGEGAGAVEDLLAPTGVRLAGYMRQLGW